MGEGRDRGVPAPVGLPRRMRFSRAETKPSTPPRIIPSEPREATTAPQPRASSCPIPSRTSDAPVASRISSRLGLTTSAAASAAVSRASPEVSASTAAPVERTAPISPANAAPSAPCGREPEIVTTSPGAQDAASASVRAAQPAAPTGRPGSFSIVVSVASTTAMVRRVSAGTRVQRWTMPGACSASRPASVSPAPPPRNP